MQSRKYCRKFYVLGTIKRSLTIAIITDNGSGDRNILSWYACDCFDVGRLRLRNATNVHTVNVVAIKDQNMTRAAWLQNAQIWSDGSEYGLNNAQIWSR